MTDTQATKENDIEALIPISPIGKLVGQLPNFTEKTRKFASQDVLTRGSYIQAVSQELKWKIPAAAASKESSYHDVINSRVLSYFIKNWLDYGIHHYDYREREVILMPENYVDHLRNVESAISTIEKYDNSTSKVLVKSISSTLNRYLRFLAETYDIEAINFEAQESKYHSAEDQKKEYIGKETKKQEARQNADWNKLGQEVTGLLQMIADTSLGRVTDLADLSRELISKLKLNEKQDPIPEEITEQINALSKSSAFINSAVLQEKKEEFLTLLDKKTKKIKGNNVIAFRELFNKAVQFSEQFENNSDPFQSHNIGQELEVFATKSLTSMANQFAETKTEPNGEEPNDLNHLCETIYGNKKLTQIFMDAYMKATDYDMEAVAKVANALKPAP